MATNPYDLLGVSKTATQDEIKKAYRKMARNLHPDVNPDKKSAEKFKTVTAAYDLLSDKDKRRRFDAGEIDAEGNPTPFGGGAYDRGGGGFGGGFNPGGGGGRGYRTQNIDPEDLESIFGGFGGGGGGFNFADLFGMGGTSRKRRGGFGGFEQEAPGQNDVSYELEIPFNLSITGGETTVGLMGGKRLKVKIPAGVTEGATLRLKGQGQTKSGDALIKIKIQKSAVFTREGDNVVLNVPLTLKEAVLGATITIPTPSGHVSMKITPYTSSGKVFRLKGKGVTGKGDLLVKITVVLPENKDMELSRFMESWIDPQRNPRNF
ncbi:MAG: DnaJ domain-containing protein [Lactobacillales bacterium]|jgi:DnaJ-class molecular chaperone|nr:DnaJ domain-containing protein [Lactobacillales bacterium]